MENKVKVFSKIAGKTKLMSKLMSDEDEKVREEISESLEVVEEGEDYSDDHAEYTKDGDTVRAYDSENDEYTEFELEEDDEVTMSKVQMEELEDSDVDSREDREFSKNFSKEMSQNFRKVFARLKRLESKVEGTTKTFSDYFDVKTQAGKVAAELSKMKESGFEGVDDADKEAIASMVRDMNQAMEVSDDMAEEEDKVNTENVDAAPDSEAKPKHFSKKNPVDANEDEEVVSKFFSRYEQE